MASYFPPLVIAGCSGAGKGTLIAKLMAYDAASFGFSVSHTTRSPRPGEVDGEHYHFSDVASVKRDIDAGLFIESANAAGKICILDIDVQGVQLVKKCGMDCKYMWIEAPDMAALERLGRARRRRRRCARMGNAEVEMAFAHPLDGHAEKPFDAYVVNGDVDAAHAEMVAVLEGWYPHIAAPKRANPCAVVSGFFGQLFSPR
ncbi:guanylate kinase [Aureococcus anophagefferens]|nr:guanylate kinase [Aureococcus anophagefferens]